MMVDSLAASKAVVRAESKGEHLVDLTAAAMVVQKAAYLAVNLAAMWECRLVEN